MNFINSIYKQFKTFKPAEKIKEEENILYKYFYDCSKSNGRIDLFFIFNHDEENIKDEYYKEFIHDYIHTSITVEKLQILKKEKINEYRHYYLKKATLTDINKYENLSEDIKVGNLIFIKTLKNDGDENFLLIDINDMYTIEKQFIDENNKEEDIQTKLDNEFNNILNSLNDRFTKFKKSAEYTIKYVNDKNIKKDFEEYKKIKIQIDFYTYANTRKGSRGSRGGGNKTPYKLYTNKKTNLAYINYNNKKSYFYENDNKIYIKINDKNVYLTKQSISYDEKLNSYFVKL